jgi:hypothetical protein
MSSQNTVRMQGERPANVAQADWSQLQNELGKVSSGGMTMADMKNATPEQMGNDPKMEMMWAEKAGRHAEAYFKILGCISDKSKMKLTSYAFIYCHKFVYPFFSC